ncbi:hypothetical protein [Brunnivagina elsteri]|nr:hypothetical protein [Calothrix elsteri]
MPLAITLWYYIQLLEIKLGYDVDKSIATVLQQLHQNILPFTILLYFIGYKLTRLPNDICISLLLGAINKWMLRHNGQAKTIKNRCA